MFSKVLRVNMTIKVTWNRLFIPLNNHPAEKRTYDRDSAWSGLRLASDVEQSHLAMQTVDVQLVLELLEQGHHVPVFLEVIEVVVHPEQDDVDDLRRRTFWSELVETEQDANYAKKATRVSTLAW